MIALLALWLAAAEAPLLEASTPPVGAIPCVACRADAEQLLRRYSESDWRRLRSGDVLIAREHPDEDARPAGRARAASLIPHSPERVWKVLTDFEAWPGFVPLVTGTRVVRREGGRAWVRQDYRVLFVRMQHTTIYDFAPDRGRLGWTLDREAAHDIAASEGSWQLCPVGGDAHTLVAYRAAMDAGRAVPDFVEDLLARRSLEGLLKALRAEVARRYAESEPAD